MALQKIAAFSDGAQGGNPAGVWISDILPAPAEMQRIAAELGFSETAFAAPEGDGRWRVRYYAPEAEVPFCGHATIALGAALARPLWLVSAKSAMRGAISERKREPLNTP